MIDWQRNGEFLKEPGYYTTLIGDQAVELIDQQDGKKPSPTLVPSAAIDPLTRGVAPTAKGSVRQRPLEV